MNYYRRYVGDYLRDTARLSMLEHGAYNLLLDYYYADEKPLPADLDELYLMVRAMTPADRKSVDKVLRLYFVLEPDGYHNGRADHEIRVSQTARGNGGKGGRKPVDNGTGMETGTVTGLPTGSPTEQGTEHRTGEGAGSGHPPTTNHQPPPANRQPPSANRHTAASDASPSEGSGEARTTRLPAHWRPGIELTASTYADNPGWNEDKFERVLADFRDHWRSKGERREDWDAAWRKWVRGEGNGKGSNKPANLAEKNLAATSNWTPPQ